MSKNIAGLFCLIFLFVMPITSVFSETSSVNDSDMITKLKDLQKKADEGNPEMQFILGSIYKEGKDLPQNIPEAIRLFTQAANKNVTRAQYALGEIYDKGDGVAQNYTEAIKWYRLAAETGYKHSGDWFAIRAGCRLNVMYSSGEGVVQDNTEADKWIQIIYENGKGEPLLIAGDFYFYLNQPPNANIGLKLYRIAADQGNIEAFNKLGDIYKDGLGGITKDYAEAVKWFSKAARLRNAHAQLKLGDIYKEGRYGVPQNYKEAVKWYRLASAQNDAFALRNLGEMYENGYGVPKNLKEAVRLYELSAKKLQKDIAISAGIKSLLSVTQLMIANRYNKGGSGLAKDNVKAYAWFSLAFANGLEDIAGKNMENLSQKMKPSQIEKAQKLAKELCDK